MANIEAEIVFARHLNLKLQPMAICDHGRIWSHPPCWRVRLRQPVPQSTFHIRAGRRTPPPPRRHRRPPAAQCGSRADRRCKCILFAPSLHSPLRNLPSPFPSSWTFGQATSIARPRCGSPGGKVVDNHCRLELLRLTGCIWLVSNGVPTSSSVFTLAPSDIFLFKFP